jgi:CBS domain-containing protein
MERIRAMKVKQAMHRNVSWQSPDTRLGAIAHLMAKEDIGAVPLGENDRLVGIVTDRDIIIRGLANGSNLSDLTARDVMTKGVVYCMEEDNIEEAARLMGEKKIRRLPVLNEKRRLVGMLSLGDVSAAASDGIVSQLAQSVASHH